MFGPDKTHVTFQRINMYEYTVYPYRTCTPFGTSFGAINLEFNKETFGDSWPHRPDDLLCGGWNLYRLRDNLDPTASRKNGSTKCMFTWWPLPYLPRLACKRDRPTNRIRRARLDRKLLETEFSFYFFLQPPQSAIVFDAFGCESFLNIKSKRNNLSRGWSIFLAFIHWKV